MEFTETFKQTGPCSFSPNARFLAVAVDYRLVIRDVLTLKVVQLFSCLDKITYIEWALDSEYVLCGLYKRPMIQAWSLTQPEWTCKIDEGHAGISYARWSPDSRHILTTSEFQLRLTVWSLLSTACIHVQWPKHGSKGVSFTKDGKFAAICTRHDCKDYVNLLSCYTWEIMRVFAVDTLDLADIQWSPDDSAIIIWDSPLEYKVLIYSPDGRCLSKYQAYENGLGVKSVSWSPCSQFLAVGSYDQMIRVLNHLTWKVFAEFTHLSTVRGPCGAAIFKEVDEPLQLDMSELSLDEEFIQRNTDNAHEAYVHVRYDVMELPITLPSQKPPVDKPNPKQGIGAMENGEAGGTGVVRSVEMGTGGEDVCSDKDLDVSSADHLVVMVHGIVGRASDWKFGAEQLVKAFPDKVFVHCSEKNMASLTLDGVDVMGERLAEEVLEVVKRKSDLRKISFIAHSVGGLVARYAIGILYRPRGSDAEELSVDEQKENLKGTIADLEPVNFITVATPHLGSRGNKQVPFLFGVTALEKVAGLVIHLIFRRTGRHLFLTDYDEGKPPLLRRMVEDNEDYPFMSALQSFQRRVAYSNAGYDHIVGWRTSSIRRNSELPKWEDSVDEKYPHVVYEELCKACGAEQGESLKEDGLDKLEEELVNGLSRLSWEKVDVSFHKSKFKYAAHTLIQVKDGHRLSEGADVIQHIIDHFLL
ncbi:hypothetical protein F511_14046 [Dorcoceras hygrometricum]|uniref:DUF676 domain-containing protein n=1 Tax=Dorcoceras hygrometricum TaxID=472368 RepID=A0A2Z7C8S1_9LAMI|nr:hypothetical protein F511_14046 [Dorcoceras hygrometricum]